MKIPRVESISPIASITPIKTQEKRKQKKLKRIENNTILEEYLGRNVDILITGSLKKLFNINLS